MVLTCTQEIIMYTNDTIFLRNLSDRQFFPETVQVVLVICYVSLYTVNLIGNTSIWIAIISQKTLHTPMNYFLLNLSLAHIVSGSNAVFFAFVTDTGSVVNSQTSLDALCACSEGLCVYFTGVGTYLFTLCGISLNRYIVIKYPTRRNLLMKGKGVLLYSVFVWLLCSGITLPSFVSFQYNKNIRLCLRSWQHFEHPFIYRAVMFTISFFVPITCLMITLCTIIWKRWSINEGLGRYATNIITLNLQKAERQIGTSFLVFFITWLPFSIYWCLWTGGYFKGCDGSINAMKWIRLTVLFSTLNGSIDPFIYTFGSTNLRVAVVSSFRTIFPQAKNGRLPQKEKMDRIRMMSVATISSQV
ncbi:neuropeptide FF receptor 2-like [Hydractinia symbiolongicarpus]|uniref:neuropeptide FF receptor 2-like n=1 Tax=Hydractinia symbiolongicarpus TaxID=13093 RepID=UPI00254E3C8A|nr:neuropeptide FF receptor 2-like [Hydractinia symbiolongicarpus]